MLINIQLSSWHLIDMKMKCYNKHEVAILLSNYFVTYTHLCVRFT